MVGACFPDESGQQPGAALYKKLRSLFKAVSQFFNVWEIAQNRPREQDFDAWQTSAEVKAGSARFRL